MSGTKAYFSRLQLAVFEGCLSIELRLDISDLLFWNVFQKGDVNSETFAPGLPVAYLGRGVDSTFASAT